MTTTLSELRPPPKQNRVRLSLPGISDRRGHPVPHPFGAIMVTPYLIALTLPMPPTINRQYATIQGRRVLSSQGRTYKITVAHYLIAALSNHPKKRQILQAFHTNFLSFSITFYFSSLLKRDLDGGLKITQDAICNALEVNDNRIVEIHLLKLVDTHHPRIESTLSITNNRIFETKIQSPWQGEIPAKTGKRKL